MAGQTSMFGKAKLISPAGAERQTGIRQGTTLRLGAPYTPPDEIPPEKKKPAAGDTQNYRITDKKSGKVYSMPWGVDAPPTRKDAEIFIHEQEKPSIGKAMEWANTPLVDVSPTMRRAMEEYKQEHPVLGAIGELGVGAMTSQSSPLGLGLSAVAGGAGIAKLAGFGRSSRLLNATARGAGYGMLGQGSYNAATGAYEGNYEKAAGGILEAIGGGLAATSRPHPDMRNMRGPYEQPDPFSTTRNGPYPTPEETGLARRGPTGWQYGRGGGQGPNRPNPPTGPIIDAEYATDAPPLPAIGAGPTPPKQLTGRSVYYGGPTGMRSNLDNVGPEGLTPSETAQQAMIPDRYKPAPVVPPRIEDIGTGPYNVNRIQQPPRRDPLAQGRVGAQERSQPRTIAEINKNPYAKTDIKDVEFLASTGDADAIAEVARRKVTTPKVQAKTRPFVPEASPAPAAPLADVEPLTPPVPPIVPSPAPKAPAPKPAPIPSLSTPEAFKEWSYKSQAAGHEPDVINASRKIADYFGEDITKSKGMFEFDDMMRKKYGAQYDKTVDTVLEGKPLPTRPRGGSTTSMFGGGQFESMGKIAKETIEEIGAKFRGLGKPDFGKMGETVREGAKAGYKAAEKVAGFHPHFEDWVNERRATKIEGILKQREFRDLDSLGQQGIFDFQDGVKSGRLADVDKYFQNKFAELTKGGVRLGYRENYLPQLWDNPVEEVFETYRRLGLKPSFALPRVLENYKAGIEQGLTPKFKTISDLMGWYESRANKALADRKMFDHLVENNQILPRAKAPTHWKPLDAKHFPVQKFKTKKGIYEQTLFAPGEIADKINNYLTIPESKLNSMEPGAILQYLADKASLSKNVALSSGVPGTGINAHGANILARTVMGNPKESLRVAKFIVKPSLAAKEFEVSMHLAPEAVRHGLTLTTEGHELGVHGSSNLVGAAFKKLTDVQGKWFEDPLFQKIMPAVKLKHWSDMRTQLVADGMEKAAASKQAATMTNDLYGGINWEAMGKSRDWQNVKRMFILAPDWLQTNVNLGKSIGKALLDPSTPVGKQYTKMAGNILGAYAAANVVNYAFSGKLMAQNPPGHAFDIAIGRSGESDRYIRPFGTAADFLRLPLDIASAAVKGDLSAGFRVAKNRASIPAGSIGNLFWNQDDFGKAIHGRDAYGKKIPFWQQVGGITSEITAPVTPQYVGNAIRFGTGRINAEQAIMGGIEAPLRYAKRPSSRGGALPYVPRPAIPRP